MTKLAKKRDRKMTTQKCGDKRIKKKCQKAKKIIKKELKNE